MTSLMHMKLSKPSADNVDFFLMSKLDDGMTSHDILFIDIYGFKWRMYCFGCASCSCVV